MLDLTRFARRVRIVRAWLGAAVGVSVAGIITAIWAALDWMGRADASALGIAIGLGIGAIVGALVGALLPLPARALRASVDRRGALENRLTASNADVPFADEIRADAAAHLAGVRPRQIYPLRFGRWQGGAIASAFLASTIFLLGSTPILLSPEAKAAREEMAKKAKVIERVTKEQFETPEAQKELTEGERRLLEEARRLQRDLEKGRMSPEEAMQKAHELQKKAEELIKQTVQESQKSLDQAETAMEKIERAELEKAGLGQVDPQLLQMPQGQKDELKAKNAAQQRQLQKQLDAIDKRLAEIAKRLANKGISEAERKALEAERKSLEEQKKALEAEMKAAQQLGEALKLSDQARSVLDKMRNHELMKEIRALAEKMAKANQQASQTGRPPLTKEQLTEMKAKLEELLAKLKDDKAMEEYLQQMIEAMKNAQKGQGSCLKPGGLGMCLASLLGLKSGPGPGDDGLFMDTGHVNKLDKPAAGQGKTFETQISGARRETGEETFVEIKAPTTIGNRSAVPYRSVLPSYEKRAEQALGRQEIPKEHEKRVRAYFESLTKG